MSESLHTTCAGYKPISDDQFCEDDLTNINHPDASAFRNSFVAVRCNVRSITNA